MRVYFIRVVFSCVVVLFSSMPVFVVFYVYTRNFLSSGLACHTTIVGRQRHLEAVTSRIPQATTHAFTSDLLVTSQ